jgi:cysteine-rich repeat protein
MRETTRRACLALSTLTLASVALGLGTPATPARAADCSGVGPWINEFDYDDISQGGVLDSDEFVEIAAPAGTDISGYQVLAVEGNPGGLLGLPCSTGFGADVGESYFTGTVPPGTVIGDDTGTGVGFYVMCFTDTSEDIGANCDVVVPGVANDSNLKNGDLFNVYPTLCPDGALLLDPADAFADSVSWEGVIPDQGPYGAYFSYNVGRDLGSSELESFEKTTGIGRATSPTEWQLSGSLGSTPGALNPGQSLVCDAPTVCGDGALDPGEDCDDGNNADGDCCSATCSFETSGSSCDDGNACTVADVCDGAGTCTAGAPLVCDDGQFCNGTETCDAIAGCQAGTPVDPDDGVACTTDSCDEGADVVVNAPNDAFCDDGQFCNGAETCDAIADCQAGTPVDPDDGVACTTDSCDEGADVVVNAPDDGLCDGGPACTAGSCDAISGCAYTPIPGCAPAVPLMPNWGMALISALLGSAAGLWLRQRRIDAGGAG